MKNLIFILFFLAACTAPPQPVTLSVKGQGLISIGYKTGDTWIKNTIETSWQLDTEAAPGDTIQLAAYGNAAPVEIRINETYQTIAPGNYGLIRFIVK